MKEIIKRFYGFSEEEDLDDLESFYSTFSKGIAVNNLQYHPELDTETETAVSAFIHQWYHTLDVMGVDIGAPDDYDYKDWKLFMIEKESQQVIKEYDWNPSKEKKGRMTFCGTSLFGHWVCVVLEDLGRDITPSNEEKVTVNLEVPEYVGDEISDSIKKETGKNYNPRKYCFKAEMQNGFKWCLLNDTEVLLDTESGLAFGLDLELFEMLMGLMQKELEDYIDLVSEDEECR